MVVNLPQRVLAASAARNRAFFRNMKGDYHLLRAVFKDRAFLRAILADRQHFATQLSIKAAQDQRAEAFKAEFVAFVALQSAASERLTLRWEDSYPCLEDRTTTTPFDRHYLYHPAWAARVLAKTRPSKHVDISSTVAFCSIVSAFIPVDFYDFRPAGISLDQLHCGSADLTSLPFADNSITSLSCMHVLEHIGLGRYGDPLNPDGDLKSIRELVRVLAPGGNLLVATPVGKQRIQFNAHRIYDAATFTRYFAPLELVELALIEENGNGGLVLSPKPELLASQTYGCGCFWLRKPSH